ncbi:TetR/AcrR family transcriptional regulator [Calidifontibacter sp. DB0510]|uniref:TetR/AcrR family transcriptional regulator n=1 Tax=Metallococcus carri TaxID=1656884 RepID=A0A967B4Q5_9MICO|nr:TetR/AcrR family transcriptional regulator [Metallococcus carri]NHN55587.1 TetR/AcrR family transcriptional regulator [Metallococcus carri]NOP38229.1 TetR/AcrR family transcriptional regulator [Calidifontibacter sp. DB2511S]
MAEQPIAASSDPEAELTPILRAALEEFVEHGYDGTSVRTIAARVGVTVPALYYHHENKQALLAELLDRAMAVVVRHTAEAEAAAGPVPRDRMAAMVRAIVGHMTNHQGLAFLDAETRALTPDNRKRYVAQRDQIEDLMRSCLRDGLADGSFSTPWVGDCTRAILSMLQGIASWYREDGPDSREEIAEHHVQLALALAGAVRPPAPTPTAARRTRRR